MFFAAEAAPSGPGFPGPGQKINRIRGVLRFDPAIRAWNPGPDWLQRPAEARPRLWVRAIGGSEAEVDAPVSFDASAELVGVVGFEAGEVALGGTDDELEVFVFVSPRASTKPGELHSTSQVTLPSGMHARSHTSTEDRMPRSKAPNILSSGRFLASPLPL